MRLTGFFAIVRRRCFLHALCVALIAGCAWAQQPASPLPAPGVRYEPTSPDVVEVMLRLANVRPDDVVYDLGCGDGRIVIAAVRAGAGRGVCVDVDPRRIAESRDNAREAGVADRIRFLNQDLFTADLAEATVVMLFLSPDFNLKLRPKLERELKPGARIVSHWHDMGDWPPRETVRVTSGGRARPVYLWIK
jgi:SAM-dependent methyltransferase